MNRKDSSGFLIRSLVYWLAAIFVLAFLASTRAHAAIIYPGESLQQAIDTAQPGEVLELVPGTFSGDVTLRPGVAISGAGAESTTLEGSIHVPLTAADVTLMGFTGQSIIVDGPRLSLSDVTLTGMAEFSGADVTVSRAAFTNTVYFQGAGSSHVTDASFAHYLVGRDQARVYLERIATSTVSFTWDEAFVEYLDATFGDYLELAGSSTTLVRGGGFSSAYVNESAGLEIQDVTTDGTIGVNQEGHATLLNSSIETVVWNGEASISISGGTIRVARLNIPAGVQASVTGLAPGLVTRATGASSTGPFGVDVENAQLESVAVDVYGELWLAEGGINGYSYIRDGGAVYLDGGAVSQYTVIESGGLGEFSMTSLEHDIIVRGALHLHTTTATSSLLSVEGNGSLEMDTGADHDRIQLTGEGVVRIDNAHIFKAIVAVEEGYQASILGLASGVSTGVKVAPGSLGGPTLELAQGDISSIQLWIRGEADLADSAIDDYLVVEATAVAHIRNSTFNSFALFRGDSTTVCTGCTSEQFLYAEERAALTMRDGVIENYAEMRGESLVSLVDLVLDGTIYTTGQASTSVDGCFSSTSTIQVGGSSTTTIASSELHAVKAFETGITRITGGQIGTLTVEVGEGLDFEADGLAPGLLDGVFGPSQAGPSLEVTGADVVTTSVLARGTIAIINSDINGYAYVYAGGRTRFESSTVRDVTYLLPGSTNEFIASRIEGLFNVQGTDNRFEATTFTAGASIVIGASSGNTFTGCTFEKPITLADNSTNNFGDSSGTNPGGNDFSLANGYFKLANHSPNEVMAQHCYWGAETSEEIAGFIIDQKDDPGYGKVNFEPFAVKNRLPVVDAGEDLTVDSVEQEDVSILATAYDEEGDLMSYRWLEGETVLLDTSPVPPSGEVSLHLSYVPLLEYGEHVLALEVWEDGDETRVVVDEVVLTIGNSSPVGNPRGAGVYEYGDPMIVLGGDVADYDGDVLTYTWWLGQEPLAIGSVLSLVGGQPSALPDYQIEIPLSLGLHVFTLTLEDGVNGPVSYPVDVTIVDVTPPIFAPVAEPSILWPPNGKMVPVTIETNVLDNAGGLATVSATVTSNEPRWQSDGEADWTDPVADSATGIVSVDLRAERNKRGGKRARLRSRDRGRPAACQASGQHTKSRIYTIWLTATDESGNSVESRVTVTVPGWGFLR